MIDIDQVPVVEVKKGKLHFSFDCAAVSAKRAGESLIARSSSDDEQHAF